MKPFPQLCRAETPEMSRHGRNPERRGGARIDDLDRGRLRETTSLQSRHSSHSLTKSASSRRPRTPATRQTRGGQECLIEPSLRRNGSGGLALLSSLAPERFEPIGRQVCVARGVADVLVAEVVLNRPRVLPVVRSQQARTRLATVEAPAPRASTVRDSSAGSAPGCRTGKACSGDRRQKPGPWLGRLLEGRLTFDAPSRPAALHVQRQGHPRRVVAGAVPSLAMVTPAGFEPAISTLKGLRPRPG